MYENKRSCPHLAKPHLAKPHLARIGILSVLAVCVLCVEDFGCVQDCVCECCVVLCVLCCVVLYVLCVVYVVLLCVVLSLFFFSLSRRKFHSFFSLWGVFSWNFGGV